jgi:hypothetical protein
MWRKFLKWSCKSFLLIERKDIKLSKLLTSKPITIRQANEFIKQFHRHHRPTTRNSGRWAIAAINTNDEIVGVSIVGNPVSATMMDGYTVEITRLCVREDAPKGTCSFLLSKCCTIWRTMGGKKVITYTLDSESGSSLKGAGWQLSGIVKPHRRWQNKTKADGVERDSLKIYELSKKRWERNLQEAV